MYSLKKYAILILSLGSMSLVAQTNRTVIVDDHGVMRWNDDHTELHGFGVNYTLPFAHEYRMANRAGIAHEEAIRQDVYHMARLDLDLYRVHVWDTEISDTLGNLIANDHLRLFDFAVNEMTRRGMNIVITPIAFWGNGWPEPDEPTPGFSYKYGKGACLTNPSAINAQARYLNQFLNHVNPYTGLAYKDAPNVLAFEISNEPHHGGTANEVTAYINTMVASMRETGCHKPIFYNMSHSINLVDGYLNANIQGGTFQWYPTNLVANAQINGNFLPHVNSYPIPFANDPRFKKMAKIVYEFDPADVVTHILYPAMAQTFRETGMQLATQFAYDAMCWAPFNTNYGTHFMNLAYAPQKAISLKIASAVFHNVPMHGSKSDKTPLRINYEQNLAEWATDDKFFYTNRTQTKPLDASLLQEVAGYGSSPVVTYNGTGAYFLDKLSDGVWRLEVMPDAYWIDDPYGKASPQKQKAAVMHSLRHIALHLPNLGTDIQARPINTGNRFVPSTQNGGFDLMPGVYIVTRKGVEDTVTAQTPFKHILVGDYVAPANNLNQVVVWNRTPVESVVGKPATIVFDAVSPTPINRISVVMWMGDKWKTVVASQQQGNSFSADIPQEMNQVGFLNYQIMVEGADGTTTFPGRTTGNPWSWEKTENAKFILRVVPEKSPLMLWDAQTDWESTYKIWNNGLSLKPNQAGETSLSVELAQLPAIDPVNNAYRGFAFKFYFGNKCAGRTAELAQKKYLVIKATNLSAKNQPISIGLVDKNGTAMAARINIDTNKQTIRIPLSAFAPSDYLILPRPFPDFLPLRVTTGNQPFDWSKIETLQVEITSGKNQHVMMQLDKIWLE